MDVRPYTVAIAGEALDDLSARLRNTRWPDAIAGMDWEDGTDAAFLRRMTDYWRTTFDWRAQEARLNALPQFIARIDELDIHFIHVRGNGPRPQPLLITHGWPGTNFDMIELIPMLTDPAAHGGDAADAFDVIVPALPGYGFSERPAHPGVGPERVAEMWAKLMDGLGYEAYGVQGGDWGAAVSTWLAYRFPERVTGLHLHFIPGRFRPALSAGPPLSADEQSFLSAIGAWFEAEGGYHHLQSTRPQTAAYALNDSPAGLAAWLVEKYRGWSDCGGDVERVFTLDEMLTNISIVWFTQTIGSTMRFYREDRLTPTVFEPGERIHPPLGVAVFPADMMPPRAWIERVFANVVRYTPLSRGGHLGALEAPDELTRDVQQFFRSLRVGE